MGSIDLTREGTEMIVFSYDFFFLLLLSLVSADRNWNGCLELSSILYILSTKIGTYLKIMIPTGQISQFELTNMSVIELAESNSKT